MQLITFLSAATAMVATASARSAVEENQKCNKAEAYAKVVNRCDYPVYLWSVFKDIGCPGDGMVTLEKGEVYYENLHDPRGGDVGVSIKISKEQECTPTNIVQLEYFLEKRKETGFNLNYLDVSYVDCLSNDCPTKSEGFYLQAGDQTGKNKASASNTWCPILSCTDAASCAKMAYILPDDVQTKTCGLTQNMEFHMCGGNAPGGESYEDDESYEPASSSSVKASSSTSQPAPSSTKTPTPISTETPTSTQAGYSYGSDAKDEVYAPAITSVATAEEPVYVQKIKTEVVYVTAYGPAYAKRHGHDHARRHQQFRA